MAGPAAGAAGRLTGPAQTILRFPTRTIEARVASWGSTTDPTVNINRVVLLSDGQYNVHIIGVNWPHHVFVNQDPKVIGAE